MGRGVKLGRKPKLTDHQKREAIRRRDIDGEPVREIARSYNVCHRTITTYPIFRPRAGACWSESHLSRHRIVLGVAKIRGLVQGRVWSRIMDELQRAIYVDRFRLAFYTQ
jgi:hypothetical protein